jgi:hypothetical protein
MTTTRFILPLLALSLLSSCASVSVRNERRNDKQPVQKPAKIYVADFSTEKGTFKPSGDAGKNLEAFKKNTAEALATNLVKRLDMHVAPAQRTSSVRGLPKSGWLVTGQLIRVNAGSLLLRAGIGLGAGGSKLETRVQVIDLASGTQPFLTFETTGGSNAQPGLLTSPAPVSAVISLATAPLRGLKDDNSRTSRMITGTLNEYLVERGWLPENRRYSAKRLGKFQFLHEQYRP